VSLRVVVADDQYLVRAGVQDAIAGEPGIEVSGAAADYEGLIAAVDRLAPDVVVTDIRMPPTGTDEGIRAATLLRDTHPEVGVVVLSQYTEPRYVLRLLDRGAARRAYLLKERVGNRAQLVGAIREVAAGGSVIDAEVVAALVAERDREERSPLAALSEREREVLAEVACGKSNGAIAESLVLTKRAVEKHINAIFSKLGLADDPAVSRRVVAALMLLADERPGAG
jgi:DNA-binding NarL/FixJ family response regulator